MSPARRRQAVMMLVDRKGLSERRACEIVGEHRSTQRREPCVAMDDAALRARLRRGLIDELITELPTVDVHVIARHAVNNAASREQRVERPDADALLHALRLRASRAGLRVYLGYAPGCGTTTAMLEEARRRNGRGSDVVVAAVNTGGRAGCEASLEGLEVLGGRDSPAMQGRVDVDALLLRNPEVACIDDLAGVDTKEQPIADSVPRLLRNGMVLIATVHLTELRSTVEGMGALLGEPPARLLDDSVLDMASEIEIIDITPSVLDERLRRGDIVPPDQAAQARMGLFRPDVLAALREIAFRLIADHTDRRLLDYMRQHGIDAPWEARPRVMLCVPPRPGMEVVIDRTERLVQRLDGRLIAVTVRDHERSEDERALLGRYASLVHRHGGAFETLREPDAAKALAAHARQILATHVIVTRGRGRRGTLRRLIGLLTDVDVHILPAPDAV